jgi:hypothetical protein
MAGISKYNGAGYLDLTAYEALRRVQKSEREARAKKRKPLPLPQKPRPFVYIASPYRGDTKTNTANALRYCRYAIAHGMFPIAPHVWLPQFMDDENKSERKLALNSGLWFLNLCSEVWVFGNIATEGMQGEIMAARRLNKKIRYFADNGKEIFETRRPPQ